MQRKKYEHPPIVEELVFQVNPELVDRYLDGDFTCFTQGLEKWPGFLGSEVWASADRPGYVRNIVYWKDKASLEAVDPVWVAEADARLNALMGGGNLKLLEVAHAVNQMTLVQEYR